MLTLEHKAHLQKKKKPFNTLSSKVKKKKSSCNKSDPHIFHQSASENHLKVQTPLAFPVITSNSEYCWKSLVGIDQTVRFETESSYHLLIVNKQEGTGR